MLVQCSRLFISYLKHSMSTVKDVNPSKALGKLSIIPTPIGNMGDLTPNILKSLYKADLIACEDRRVAGQLYTLIKNKKIIPKMEENFGTLGLTNVIPVNEQTVKTEDYQFTSHQFYNYSNMGDKARRKFVSRMSLQEQKAFKMEYLKYRARKIINKEQQFMFKSQTDKLDELYGLEVSDFKHVESQIYNTRRKKGRGILIPLNTYSETKMFDLVKHLLETKHVALISDAGMPCISDPGWRMVSMVRDSLPEVDIEVIGGPTSVDTLITVSKITAKDQTMSGRFEGFASPQVSNITQESVKLDMNLKLAKEKDFSIHFINSRKLHNNIHKMEKIYGQKQKIVVTNELTKRFQRKFHGSLKELRSSLSHSPQNFDPRGQMCYLLYNDRSTADSPASSPQNTQETNKQISVKVNIQKFIDSLDLTSLKSLEKAQLISSIFGIKFNQAKKLVYYRVAKQKSDSS